jgi:predicted DNA-binding transcriptional regulator YafY
MLAYDEAAGIVKTFYVPRIEDAVLTERRYAIPKGFDPNSYYRDTFGLFVGGGPSFRFRVRFSKELADEIRERQWHQDQKIEEAEDGGIVLELPVRSVEEARRFVLEYGSGATVLSPPELVEDVRRQVEKMRVAYEGRETGGGRPAGKAKGGR